jgi:hypothetical protein
MRGNSNKRVFGGVRTWLKGQFGINCQEFRFEGIQARTDGICNKFAHIVWRSSWDSGQTKRSNISVGHTLLCIVDLAEDKSQNMHMTTCMIES